MADTAVGIVPRDLALADIILLYHIIIFGGDVVREHCNDTIKYITKITLLKKGSYISLFMVNEKKDIVIIETVPRKFSF